MSLSVWGWDDHWDEARSRHLGMDLVPGRVVSQERTGWAVQTAQEMVEAVVSGGPGGPLRPVVGDWVLLEPGEAGTAARRIADVLPRRSAFSRGAAGDGNQEQIVAANVDRVWIVHGLDADPNPRRIERYLALAWESGAVPEIVLTKSDLVADPEVARDALAGVAFGVPVWVVSSADPPSLGPLRSSLNAGQTIALLGPSGVGKSTLVNGLVQATVAATGDVRDKDRKGRHTTTRRQLFAVPGGALLLDTPGMREVRVWELGEGLAQAFPDIGELAHRCRFRDCAHESEPGCAVLEATESGALPPERLESYRKLRAEAAYQARKSDPEAQARSVAEFKSIMKSLKNHHPKYRDR